MSCGSLVEWNTFLAVQAGASATLTGLVFVAVSINLSRIMEVPGLPGRAAESILQFLEVFFISTVAMIPGQSAQTAAMEFLALGVIFWAAQVIGQIRYLRVRSGQRWSWFVHRAVLTQFATIPFFLAGLIFLMGNCDAFYWLVPGFLFSFAAGLISAWVLLVEILR